jgi:hypothetical protein
MSEKQQFSTRATLGPEERVSRTVTTGTDRKVTERRAVDPKKRAILKQLVKKNTKCHHLQIYTQANVICRRISYSYEEGKISEDQAMALMFEAHEQMSHRGLPKEVVAIEMHKRLDKLEGNDKTSFAIIMANTNSSVHVRGPNTNNSKPEVEDASSTNDSSLDKYSESYWAEVI